MGAIFKLIRFNNLLILAFTQILVAIALVGISPASVDLQQWLPLFFIVLSTVFIAAGGYVINDYYDVKIDYINRPERVTIGSDISRRKAMFFHFIITGLGILIALILSWKTGLIAAFSAFCLWYYSNQLKRMPLIGNLTIAMLTALSLMQVSIYFGQSYLITGIYAVFAFALTVIRELIKDMEDVEGDKMHGCKTVPILWGMRNTKRLLMVFITLFILLMMGWMVSTNNVHLNIYFMGLSLPLILVVIYLLRADTKKHFKNLSLFCKLLMMGGVLSMLMV
ncbi:geranylgeranylglycerol-phosphate geranylgeranyltransferase [Persicobacter diffluens]|uniref:Ubiquinone biosynthesis protein UbiA n=1 Tax=Persicobacter diffluens TaxID=981 RepID=A0AAN5AIA3_9BACT|nr:ubiquinone biosynthesis protein UbiA [Persicobacter diffluens]